MMALVSFLSPFIFLCLSAFPVTVGGADQDCRCVVYYYEYMYCDCCPANKTTAEAYVIDYSFFSYSDWEYTEVTRCQKERSLDPAVRCDCVFCGVITDRDNPFYTTCTDPQFKYQFQPYTTYLLNFTLAGDSGVHTSNFMFETNDTILKPSPAKITHVATSVANDSSVVIDLSWRPDSRMMYTALTYLVEWHQTHTEESTQNRSTELWHMRLENLQPNVLYNISLRCRPTAGTIYSEAVSTSLKSAEKRPEFPAVLVSYQLSSSSPSSSSSSSPSPSESSPSSLSTLPEATYNISLVWQPIPVEYMWSDCQQYQVTVEGAGDSYNQTVPCADVWATVSQPLSRDHDYNVTLQVLTNMGPAPPSQLYVPSLNSIADDDVTVIAEHRDAKINVTMVWDKEATPPLYYAVFSCLGDELAGCKGDANQTIVQTEGKNRTSLVTDYPGAGYLFSVATYRDEVTAGLQDWTCVYEYCKPVQVPNVKLSEKQEAESLTLLISAPSCMANRGMAVEYYIQYKDRNKVHSDKVEAVGTVTYKMEGLAPNTMYNVSVKALGHPNCPNSAENLQHFSTIGSPEQSKEWIIPLVVIPVIFFAAVGTLLAVRYQKKKKKIAEAFRGNTDDGDADTVLDYAVIPDYSDISSKELQSDGDSGIMDTVSVEDDNQCLCQPCWACRRRQAAKAAHTQQVVTNDEANFQVASMKEARPTLLSISSQDSGHPSDESPVTTRQGPQLSEDGTSSEQSTPSSSSPERDSPLCSLQHDRGPNYAGVVGIQDCRQASSDNQSSLEPSGVDTSKQPSVHIPSRLHSTSCDDPIRDPIITYMNNAPRFEKTSVIPVTNINRDIATLPASSQSHTDYDKVTAFKSDNSGNNGSSHCETSEEHSAQCDSCDEESFEVKCILSVPPNLPASSQVPDSAERQVVVDDEAVATASPLAEASTDDLEVPVVSMVGQVSLEMDSTDDSTSSSLPLSWVQSSDYDTFTACRSSDSDKFTSQDELESSASLDSDEESPATAAQSTELFRIVTDIVEPNGKDNTCNNENTDSLEREGEIVEPPNTDYNPLPLTKDSTQDQYGDEDSALESDDCLDSVGDSQDDFMEHTVLPTPKLAIPI